MQEAFGLVANPSSQHRAGRRARAALEESRERVAEHLGVRPSEVLFTSGGTESDNLAVLGMYRKRRAEAPERVRVLVSAVEHAAVRDAAIALERDEGAVLQWIACDAQGRVHPEAVREAIVDPAAGGAGTVALVAVMAVNNEIGTVQPVEQIAQVCAEYEVPLHCDAVQSVGVLPLPAAAPGVTTLALSGHKAGAPVGIGVLVARRDAPIAPVSHGGGQERALRSGTLPLALAAAFEAALAEAVEGRAEEVQRLVALRDRLAQGVLDAVPGARITGVWTPGDHRQRSAANVHVLVPEAEGEALLFLLDAAGVECSTGSACHAGVTRPSHVVLALGHDETTAKGALRLTLGHTSTDADVDLALAALPQAVERAQLAYRGARRAGGRLEGGVRGGSGVNGRRSA